jgi:hypothetical protein
MYIVAEDNPYFPSVEFRPTLDEAQAVRDLWQAEMHDDGAPHEGKIVIGKVLEETPLRSWH